MSSTERNTKSRIKLALVGLIVSATCMSSLSFSSEAEAQQVQVRETEQLAADPSTAVAVVVVGGALAAYGWLADKVYDLGKEVGKWAAGSSAPSQEAMLSEQSADYLLN